MQQLGEPGDRPDDSVRVDTALEPGRRLRTKAEPGRGLHHTERLEPRDLQGDGGRRVGDLRVEPAHHARDADRSVVGVADQEVVGGERLHASVERRHRLSRGCHPDAKTSPLRIRAERREVVRVIRLVELEHHVVADIHDVVDGTHAGRAEASLHPRRRRTDDDARHHRRREAPAAVAGEDLDLGLVLLAVVGQLRGGHAELESEVGGEVAGDADVAPTVGTVAGDVEVEQHVRFDAENVAVRHTERAVGREDQDAGVVVTEPELARRAEHPLGVDPEDAAAFDRLAVGHRRADHGQRHDVAGLHVERAAPHVTLDAVAGVDVHPVDAGGVGMRLGAENARGHDAVDGRADAVDVLDGEPERRHRRPQRVDVGAEVGVLVEPGQQDLHRRVIRTARGTGCRW